FAQPFKHRCPTATERCFADGTAIALPFAIMDTNIALSSLASCRTRLIRAKCFRRVHWLWCTLLHKHILPGTVTSFNPSSLHRIVGSYRLQVYEKYLKQLSFLLVVFVSLINGRI